MSKYTEALDRIFNFCEEIDSHLPKEEQTGYSMLPDISLLRDAIQIADRLKQAESEKHEIKADMDKETKAYVMGYNQAPADIRGDKDD